MNNPYKYVDKDGREAGLSGSGMRSDHNDAFEDMPWGEVLDIATFGAVLLAFTVPGGGPAFAGIASKLGVVSYGDKMGKWLSGKKTTAEFTFDTALFMTPKVLKHSGKYLPKAAQYFSDSNNNMKFSMGKMALKNGLAVSGGIDALGLMGINKIDAFMEKTNNLNFRIDLVSPSLDYNPGDNVGI